MEKPRSLIGSVRIFSRAQLTPSAIISGCLHGQLIKGNDYPDGNTDPDIV
jgi:hypothetical protein